VSAPAARHRRGLLLMLGATLCWSTAGVLMRTQSLTDGWEATFWRSVFMLAFMTVVLSVQYRGAVWRRVAGIGWPGVVSGVLWAVMFVAFITALARTAVANVLVLSSVSPFLAALAGWALLGERVRPGTWIAMLAAFCGIAVMFAASFGEAGAWGNLIALAIPVAFAANVIVLRRMHARADMMPTLIVAGVVSCAVTLPFALPFDIAWGDVPNFVALGVVQLGMGCLLMIAAARHLAAAEVGLMAELETVFGVAAAWLLVGEVPSTATLIGGSIVVLALAANEALRLWRGDGRAPALEEAAQP
jgi:drug/metabolite transporter (DMT)-like permease